MASIPVDRRQGKKTCFDLLSCLKKFGALFGDPPSNFIDYPEEEDDYLIKRKILRFYTHNGPIFPLINCLLRSGNDPFSLFYIHFLFKDLFWTIKKMYK